MNQKVTRLPRARDGERKKTTGSSVSDLMAKIGLDPDQTLKVYEGAGSILSGQLIVEMRKHSELTQDALARRLGMTQQRISQLEAGRTKNGVTVGTLMSVAAACGGKISLTFVPAKTDIKYGNLDVLVPKRRR